MGTLYEVQCGRCDYGAEIAQGAGMDAVVEPAFCPTCREIREATSPVFEIEGEPPVPKLCEVCGGGLLPWGSTDLDGDLVPGMCPRCKGAVTTVSIGIWD
jgi:hypothetical protein